MKPLAPAPWPGVLFRSKPTKNRRRGLLVVSNLTTQLDDVYARIDLCNDCELGSNGLNEPPRLRWRSGEPNARLLIVSQNPGQKSAEDGRVWGGLDILFRYSEAARHFADQLWISNLVKCRTHGNAKPQARHVAACEHWLLEEIQCLHPTLIVGLGRPVERWLYAHVDKVPTRYHPHPSYIRRFRFGQIRGYVDSLRKDVYGK